jgi:hypothetical protein
VFDVQGELLESARDCEAEVFEQWYGNSRAQLDDEYGPYDAHSVFIALVDGHDEAVGSCRVIAPGGALKTLDDLAREPWCIDGHRSAAAAGVDPAATWDVGTLGVRRGIGSRSVMAAAGLYHGLMTGVLVNDGRHVVSIIDERVRLMLHAVGVETHVLPGASTASYLGSPASTPLYAHMDVVLDHQRRHAPDGYRLIHQGVGLDGISVPPRAGFLLRRERRVIQLPTPEPTREPVPATVARSREVAVLAGDVAADVGDPRR